MALVLKDRVQETSVSTGTGTVTLDGAVDGYQSFVAPKKLIGWPRYRHPKLTITVCASSIFTFTQHNK